MVIRRAYCSIRAGIDVPAVGDDDGGRLAAHLGPPAADTAAARRLAGGLRPRRCSRSPWLDNTGGRSRVAGAPHPRQHANMLLRSAAGNALAAGRAVSRRADAIQTASAALREHRRLVHLGENLMSAKSCLSRSGVHCCSSCVASAHGCLRWLSAQTGLSLCWYTVAVSGCLHEPGVAHEVIRVDAGFVGEASVAKAALLQCRRGGGDVRAVTDDGVSGNSCRRVPGRQDPWSRDRPC
jgi:hypothetical protein